MGRRRELCCSDQTAFGRLSGRTSLSSCIFSRWETGINAVYALNGRGKHHPSECDRNNRVCDPQRLDSPTTKAATSWMTSSGMSSNDE